MGKLFQELRRQFDIFWALPAKKKAAHIWEYYSVHILVIFAVIALLVALVQTFTEAQRETLISGFFLNVDTTEEGYAHVSDDYWAFCGGNKEQKVELVQGREVPFAEEAKGEAEAANLTMLSVLISNHGLDYVITDEASAHFLDAENAVMDLRKLLPEERLSAFDTVQSATGTIAIRLSGTPFAEKYPLTAADSCILVISTTPEPEKVVHFLDFLLAEQ